MCVSGNGNLLLLLLLLVIYVEAAGVGSKILFLLHDCNPMFQPCYKHLHIVWSRTERDNSISLTE